MSLISPWALASIPQIGTIFGHQKAAELVPLQLVDDHAGLGETLILALHNGTLSMRCGPVRPAVWLCSLLRRWMVGSKQVEAQAKLCFVSGCIDVNDLYTNH